MSKSRKAKGFILIAITAYVVFFHGFLALQLPSGIITVDTAGGSPQSLLQPSLRNSKPTGPNIVVGYAVSLTSCSVNSTNILDGAAVLAHSIHRSSVRNTDSDSRYDYHLYAFVHPTAAKICAGPLERIGYDVQIRDTPFRLDDIQTQTLREAIVTMQCCGEKEFLKLYALTLEQHDIVVHFDLDVFVLQPMDDLFDAMLGKKSAHTPLPVMRNQSLPSRIDLFFTRDYLQKSSFHKNPSKYGVQGGFFVVRPNSTIFREMIEVVKTGDYESGRGWGQTLRGGHWGAAQIQGFLSYFYGEFHPEGAVELNRCIYNTMAKDDPYFHDGTCRTGEETCEDCRTTPLSRVKTAHMTTCWKPWHCARLPPNLNPPLCADLHREWFRLRQSLELTWGRTLPETDSGYKYERYLGYCYKPKPRWRPEYIPMKLP